MDIQEQENTYDGFIQMTKYGLYGVLGILVVLAAIA